MEDYQNKLFPYAYNIMGTVEDAKDVVQDVVSKFLSTDLSDIRNNQGYLVKSVVNHAINTKKRNQKLVGDSLWLPEPIATDRTDTNINREEIISYSLLVLLENLSPKERAVFILKEAFDYSHDEIGEVLNITSANARKLLSRSRGKMSEEAGTVAFNDIQHKNHDLERYIRAIKSGDVKSLEQMLSEEISLAADGGGRVNVVRELTLGREMTLELLFYVFQTYQELLTIRIAQINHQPALLFYKGRKLINCQIFEWNNKAGKITKIFAVVARNKLKGLF